MDRQNSSQCRKSRASSRPPNGGNLAGFSASLGIFRKAGDFSAGSGLFPPLAWRLRSVGQRRHKPRQIHLPREAVLGEHAALTGPSFCTAFWERVYMTAKRHRRYCNGARRVSSPTVFPPLHGEVRRVRQVFASPVRGRSANMVVGGYAPRAPSETGRPRFREGRQYP